MVGERPEPAHRHHHVVVEDRGRRLGQREQLDRRLPPGGLVVVALDDRPDATAGRAPGEERLGPGLAVQQAARPADVRQPTVAEIGQRVDGLSGTQRAVDVHVRERQRVARAAQQDRRQLQLGQHRQPVVHRIQVEHHDRVDRAMLDPAPPDSDLLLVAGGDVEHHRAVQRGEDVLDALHQLDQERLQAHQPGRPVDHQPDRAVEFSHGRRGRTTRRREDRSPSGARQARSAARRGRARRWRPGSSTSRRPAG